jgi:hypothetical protein
MLPSGLPELVADGEDLARFLTSSSQFNAQGAKPSAFLPAPKSRDTSVSRHGAEPPAELWQIGAKYLGESRTIRGAAIVKSSDVRAVGLSVIAGEPPPRHAAIRDWPWLDNDPDLQKAKQKERAALVASKATLVRP